LIKLQNKRLRSHPEHPCVKQSIQFSHRQIESFGSEKEAKFEDTKGTIKCRKSKKHRKKQWPNERVLVSMETEY
jgi:hypothetical protein